MIAAGAKDVSASTVADHLSDANLVGHDSHGFIRVVQYIREIEEGILKPEESPEIFVDQGSIARVTGNGTFGQVVCKFATDLAMDKANRTGISLVTTCDHGHAGRLGAYSEMVGNSGMACIMTLGTFRTKASRVAPFGGREGRLGTNPISMGFPYQSGSPIILDFATSMAAEGKVRVYRARESFLPGEWLLDAEGKPSRDPEAHKGYGLSFMVDLLGGVMSSLDRASSTEGEPTRGSSIIAIDLAALGQPEYLEEEVSRLVEHVKDSKPMDGHDGVLFPGEIESTTRKQRRRDGVVVEDATWGQIMDLIDKYGLSDDLKIVDG